MVEPSNSSSDNEALADQGAVQRFDLLRRSSEQPLACGGIECEALEWCGGGHGLIEQITVKDAWNK
jgi:hypothetical protein